MLRAARFPHSQSKAYDFALIAKRWQNASVSFSSGTVASIKSTTLFNRTQQCTGRTSTRTYSSSSTPPFNTSKGSWGGTIAKSLVYGVTLGVTGTLLYAEYENGPFRQQLESTIPYASTVLGGLDQYIDPILGREKAPTTETPEKLPDLAYIKDAKPEKEKLTPIVEPKQTTMKNVAEKLPEKPHIEKVGAQVKTVVDQVKDQVPSAATLKTKLAHAKEKVEDTVHTVKETIKDTLPSAKSTTSTVPTPTASAKASEPLTTTQPSTPPPPSPEQILLDKCKQLEEEISKLVTPLSKQIDDALEAAHQHITHMKTLIDSPQILPSDSEIWEKAENFQHQSKARYEQVTNALDEWKTKLNEYSTLKKGEIHPMQKKLEEKYQELQKQYTTSTFVKNFRTYIDDATKSFQKEIETMFPSLAGKSPSQLTSEDLQALLIHAHRRIAKLQNDIARMRITSTDTIKAAMDVERAEMARLIEERARQLVEKTTDHLTDELKSYEKNLRQQFDEQLRHEIVLQHQALTQYLADVLSRQYQEWANEYQKQLESESLKININLQNQVRATLDRLHAIEHAIEANYDSQKRGRQAQLLWIQAQNILNRFVHGTTTKNDLDLVSKIVPNERFVHVLMNELRNDELPSTTNEKTLRDRFALVNKVCRCVALVDSEHNSLRHYFLSYIQSLLMIRQRDDSILNDDAVDLTNLNTFTILNYVQSYLDQNQWYNALRLMQLLKGEARNVAQSWIQDTRNYLAKKQTSELLEAYSNSIGLGTLPRSS